VLVHELDDKATIKKVRTFFEKDFPKLLNMAHISYLDVKSPMMSDVPKAITNENTIDNKMNWHNYAIDVLNKVVKAFDGVDEKKRKSIEARYFNHLTWYEITDLTGYSRTQGSKILNDALIEFAWAFADNEDLRVFK
jgi:ArpU family phage transcriptional regulator